VRTLEDKERQDDALRRDREAMEQQTRSRALANQAVQPVVPSASPIAVHEEAFPPSYAIQARDKREGLDKIKEIGQILDRIFTYLDENDRPAPRTRHKERYAEAQAALATLKERVECGECTTGVAEAEAIGVQYGVAMYEADVADLHARMDRIFNDPRAGRTVTTVSEYITRSERVMKGRLLSVYPTMRELLRQAHQALKAYEEGQKNSFESALCQPDARVTGYRWR
jgi:hypothetical protein